LPVDASSTRRSNGINSFFCCMALVAAATGTTFAAIAAAHCGHYLAAMLTGFAASIFWQMAFEEGRKASKNLSDS
jgi:4-hydroxybenzoate polyprenyltransferase